MLQKTFSRAFVSIQLKEMVSEDSESRSRAFLTLRLSSPDDCFSSQMDSPESGDTDDVSSENDSL